jgi:hypothetical protein
MDLGTVIVMILALFFFGGIAFLSWASRRKKTSRADALAPMIDDSRVAPPRKAAEAVPVPHAAKGVKNGRQMHRGSVTRRAS